MENAIGESKIDREAKAQWVEMAEANFELAEKTLASIPAREIISKEIANDPANIQATAEATKTAERWPRRWPRWSVRILSSANSDRQTSDLN